MSVIRPVARRLVSGRLASAAASHVPSIAPPSPLASKATPFSRPSTHAFHSSTQVQARRRPRFRSVMAADLGLVRDDDPRVEEKIQEFTAEKFPRYTEKELEELSKRYTPEQLEALKAGEAAIDPRDLTVQGRLRIDNYRMPYIDDFATVEPVVDKRIQDKAPPVARARFMNLDEFTRDLLEWTDKFESGEATGELKKLEEFVEEEWKGKPEGQWPVLVRQRAHDDFQSYLQRMASQPPSSEPGSKPITDTDILEYILERSSMTDGGLVSNSALALGLPKSLPGVAGLYKTEVDPEDKAFDKGGDYEDLKKRSGMTLQDINMLHTKKLVERWVANQTRMGKIRKWSIVTVVGNGDGWMGIGIGKDLESSIASEKSFKQALLHMRPIPRYEKRTIFGSVEAKVGGTVVKLHSRPPGFGLRVQHRIWEMCKCAGIHDLSASVPRSRNPMNTVKAVFQALTSQPNPEEIAMGRGKKLVDARKVYYGGAVY